MIRLGYAKYWIMEQLPHFLPLSQLFWSTDKSDFHYTALSESPLSHDVLPKLQLHFLHCLCCPDLSEVVFVTVWGGNWNHQYSDAPWGLVSPTQEMG